MLPLSLLKTAQNHPMLVELKNGETYNGHLVSCDNWMNINLREVICTSRDGDKFWRMPECYIRGSTIKYLRIPDEIIDMVKEEVVAKGRGRGGLQQQKQQKGRGMGGTGRGVFGGRGRGGIPATGRGLSFKCVTWQQASPMYKSREESKDEEEGCMVNAGQGMTFKKRT
ncbi:U6 snRNA-associated Sm-like protein LSm4 [Manis javanica]|nr:U6 snRNA-associated Sm-like protein LSm4 [Manis javanica]